MDVTSRGHGCDIEGAWMWHRGGMDVTGCSEAVWTLPLHSLSLFCWVITLSFARWQSLLRFHSLDDSVVDPTIVNWRKSVRDSSFREADKGDDEVRIEDQDWMSNEGAQDELQAHQGASVVQRLHLERERQDSETGLDQSRGRREDPQEAGPLRQTMWRKPGSVVADQTEQVTIDTLPWSSPVRDEPVPTREGWEGRRWRWWWGGGGGRRGVGTGLQEIDSDEVVRWVLEAGQDLGWRGWSVHLPRDVAGSARACITSVKEIACITTSKEISSETLRNGHSSTSSNWSYIWLKNLWKGEAGSWMMEPGSEVCQEMFRTSLSGLFDQQNCLKSCRHYQRIISTFEIWNKI